MSTTIAPFNSMRYFVLSKSMLRLHLILIVDEKHFHERFGGMTSTATAF
jgi:hypothetical protein